jgi:hypothetical protein
MRIMMDHFLGDDERRWGLGRLVGFGAISTT